MRFDVKGRVIEGRLHQAQGDIQRRAAHRFLAVLHHHLEHTGIGGEPATTEADRATGLGLQAQGRYFDDMGGRSRHAAVRQR